MKKEIKIIELSSLDPKPQYKIFVDCTEKGSTMFSMFRIEGDIWEELLEKTFSNTDEYKEQVEKLSEYFNAEVFEKQPDE